MTKAEMIRGVNERVQKELEKQNPGRKGTPAVFIAAGNEHLLSFGLIPFGNPAVDGAIGGGVPRGGIVQVYGPEGAGKTRLFFDMIAYNQAKDSDFYAMVIHLEGRAFPLEAMLAAGVDPRRVVVINAMSSADKTFNIAFKYLWNAETSSPMEIEGRPLIDLVVVDSVAAVEPEAEVLSIIGGKVGTKKKDAKGLEGSEVALQARLMSKFFRFLCGAGALGKTTLGLINQERVDVGGYNTPRKATGGLAVAYYVKQSIKLKKDLLYDGKPGGSPVIGQEIFLEVTKNNTGLADPYKKDSYKVIYGKGVDSIGPLIALAKQYDVILETSAGRYVVPALDPESGEVLPAVVDGKKKPLTGRAVSGITLEDGTKVPGKEVLEQLLRDEQWLLDHVSNEVANRMTEAAAQDAPDEGGNLDEVGEE